MTAPTIQHWLVQVADTAGLDGAAGLRIDSNNDLRTAWAAVEAATGLSTDEVVARVAEHYGLELADLDRLDRTATTLLPAPVARRLQVLPTGYSERTITVASADPHGLESEREIQLLADRNVVFQAAAPRVLESAIEAAYPPGSEDHHRIPELSPPHDGTAHVLVVDDDEDMRFLLRSVLESKGFMVSAASDGPEVLKLLERMTFQLITLDLQMTEMHGMEVLQRVRSRVQTKHIPIIVATATGTAEAEIAALEAGADDFVVKPIDPTRFVLRVQAVLRRRGEFSSGPAV